MFFYSFTNYFYYFTFVNDSNERNANIIGKSNKLINRNNIKRFGEYLLNDFVESVARISNNI